MRLFRTISCTLLFSVSVFSLAACKKDNTPKKDGYSQRMAKEHKHDVPTATGISKLKPSQPVEGKMVQYATIDKQAIQGYLAQPKAAKGPLPALIVIHEWWGLNDNIKAMTDQLAGEGYLALAVDIYGGKSAKTPKDALALMKAAMSNKDKGQENIRQAYAYLKDKAKATKIASMGWCFGGAWSLQTALLFPKGLAAAVIYYGRLVQDKEKLNTLQMPMLGIFGAKDKGIPVDGVKKFEATLKELKKDATIKIYPDADHAFANPSGKRYREADAKDAWKHTLAFLKKHL
ncbi:MAG: dienelactone hydrolase family protein [Myxococcales bacterium]|nr:dienelactone hydrolase family protein [Myxococcales bacterium]